MERDELIRAFKDHALAHYEDGGWDVIVECWTEADIHRALGDATTLPQAIKAVEPFIDVMSDRQADARNSAF